MNKKNNIEPKKTEKSNLLSVKSRTKKYSSKFSPVINQNMNIKIIFLGGLNQIGKNITAIEFNGDIILIDCGTAFPDGEMLGVDLVIPDFSYIESNKQKIRALIITHGHEDHIGAVPYLIKKLNIPIYATPFTIGLITYKLKEHKLFGNSKLFKFRAGQNFNIGVFNIEFVHINHSIPDAVALVISTPIGKIVHTGDFKIDFTPAKGSMINLARFAELGKDNVLLLMADSTNADKPGYTKSEKNIDESFEFLFQKACNKRIIIATFASNIGRIQQIINCAVKNNRKVMFSGRSMINYVSVALELNYINVPEGIIVDIDSLGRYKNNEVVIVTTGSQGEPMSALSKMAHSEHRKVMAGPNDCIIISAHPIPGNEKSISNVVNELMKLGCEVIYESNYDVHVSGHASQEELKIIQALVKPKYFIPVHGECKHMTSHAKIANNMGLSENNILICDTGDIVEISNFNIKKIGKAPCELVMVDGNGVGDVGSVVLNDRRHLGEDGVIVIVAAIKLRDKKIFAGPDIFSRGFVYVKESEELMSMAKKVATKIILDCFDKSNCDWNVIKTECRDIFYRFFYEKTRRNPLVLPIILEIKK